MRNIILIILLCISVISMSCTHNPEPINYGSDDCAHCKMTIVENKFGAEIISTKGKVYKFDAVECMINFVNKGKMNQSDVESYWAVDYNSPGTLINASSAYYLISQNIPSPMGANLSTYTSKTNAETKKNVSGGEVFNWSELQNRIGR